VDPPFGALLGYEPGISGDEHPHGDIRIGQAFMSDVVHAFMESPQYRRGILFVTYDIGRTLDWDDPDPEPPEIPDPVAVAGAPCPEEGAARAKPHDMVVMESSGYLERLRWPTEPAHMDRIFRGPDAVKRAL